MGMYDYLGGEQVKLFYRPIFNLDKEDPMNSYYWHSGGQLRSFKALDNLPLQELWYKYPKDFLVFDFRFQGESVWVIRDGRFQYMTTYKELSSESLGVPVYDINGSPLNISLMRHFSDIQMETKILSDKQKTIRIQHFPDGIGHMMKRDMELYKQTHEAYITALRHIKEPFGQKWFAEEADGEETEFGALIDCLLFAISQTDGKEDVDALRLLIRKKVTDTPELPERFVRWVDNDKVMSATDLEQFLEGFCIHP